MIDAKPTGDSGGSDDDENVDSEDKNQKSRKRRKLAEVIYKDGKQITNKKWAETKDPYQQEVASKLDSATDISKLRLSTQQLECLEQMSIIPNEDVPRFVVSKFWSKNQNLSQKSKF